MSEEPPAPRTLPRVTIEHLLDHWPVARLATLTEDGAPQQAPIVFVRRGDRLWSPVDGKPKASGQLARIHNVRRNARVSLLLDHYAPDWTRLWWLRIDGKAWVQTSREPEADPELAPVVEGLRRKYPQYQRVSLFRGQPTLLGVRIVEMRSWCGASPDLPGLRSCTS